MYYIAKPKRKNPYILGIQTHEIVDRENLTMRLLEMPLVQIEGPIRATDIIISGSNEELPVIVRRNIDLRHIAEYVNIFEVDILCRNKKGNCGYWWGLSFRRQVVKITEAGYLKLRYSIESSFPIFTGIDQGTFCVFCDQVGMELLKQTTSDWKFELVESGEG